MNKAQLIVQDYLSKIESFEVEVKYMLLYREYDNSFQHIFGYLHQSLNSLFDFMYRKFKTNHHFNADASRDLIFCIEFIEGLDRDLKGTEFELTVDPYYKEKLRFCKGFLQESGGSSIPDDFEKIHTKNYDPIFFIQTKKITLTNFIHNSELTVIGEGAFSLVKKYYDPFYKKVFAVKYAKKDLTNRELERFTNEFEILSKLNFQYILEVYNYNSENNSYIMEYCDLTLEDFIKNNNQTLSFVNRKKLALQFLYGLNYLHRKGYLHRDLSFRNVLLKQYEFNSCVIKLSDFGLIKDLESRFTKTETDIKGTIIDPTLENFKNYSFIHELYAVGFILNFIFTGRKSLQHSNEEFSKILLQCTDNNLNKRYKDLGTLIKDVENLVW